MQKFLISIIGTLSICSAFAVGENIPTSKSYVDAALATKQDTIPANDGVTQVLTNTGTAGEYGTKGIYDSTGSYATQSDALIDAVTMNTAVQNAIDSEFQCIEYDENNECLLMQLGGITQVPAGYTQLKYLESTGTQYIDTGIIPTENTVWKLDNEFSTNAISSEFWYNGVYQDSTKRFDIALQQNDFRLNYGGMTIISTDVSAFQGVRIIYTIDAKNLIWAYGSTSGSYTKTVQGFNQPLYLFARNDITNNIRKPRRFSSQKTYFSKIFNNNVLVQNLIPARRNSDGVLGMYDTVSNTFFTNAGTGEFIAGPVVYIPQSN